MITSTSLTHPTVIAKIRAAVASAVQAKDCISFVTNRNGKELMFARWNKSTKEMLLLSNGEDITEVVKEAFAIVNNKNINKHMAVCLDNEIAYPVRMVCLG